MIKRVQGFTLIEMMIVVAIIGIIATIAIPSYQRYVQNSRCELAKADLTELAQFMERRYSTRFDYRAADDSNPALPFNTSSRDGNPVAFNIAFDGNVEQTTFTIQATPVAGMVDAITCGTAPLGNILTIDHQGNRSW